MFAWLVLSIALADCPDDPLPGVRERAAEMEATFAELEEERFDEAHAELDALLGCVQVPLALRDVLLLHRANALASFMDGDMVASSKSWGAVRVLNPEWVPPEALIPPEHLIRKLYDSSPTGAEQVQLDMRPDNGWLVDGRESQSVPAERAFVLQARTADGIGFTGYMRTVAEIPVLDFVEPVSRVTPGMWALRKKGAWVACGLVLGSAVSFLLWRVSLDDLERAEMDYDRIDGRITRTNALGVGGWALGVGAVGVFAVTWSVKL